MELLILLVIESTTIKLLNGYNFSNLSNYIKYNDKLIL